MKRAAKIYTALIFVFLFAPIAILLVFSFNDAKSLSVFSGFSLKWYYELFRDAETLNALKNTLILAVTASIVSTVMGTAAAVGMNKLRSKYLRAALDTATDIPCLLYTSRPAGRGRPGAGWQRRTGARSLHNRSCRGQCRARR